MRFSRLILGLLALSLFSSIAYAAPFSPGGNIVMRGLWGMENATHVNASTLCLDPNHPICITSWSQVNGTGGGGGGNISSVVGSYGLTGGGTSGALSIGLDNATINLTIDNRVNKTVNYTGGNSSAYISVNPVTRTISWVGEVFVSANYYLSSAVDSLVSALRVSIANNATTNNASTNQYIGVVNASQTASWGAADSANNLSIVLYVVSTNTSQSAYTLALVQSTNGSMYATLQSANASFKEWALKNLLSSVLSSSNLSSNGSQLFLNISWTTVCPFITGSAGLCDGDDNAGAGSYDLNITLSNATLVLADSDILQFNALNEFINFTGGGKTVYAEIRADQIKAVFGNWSADKSSFNLSIYATIQSANSSMKAYVDTTNSSMKATVTQANSSMQAYVGTTNSSMYATVQGANSSLVNYVGTTNTSMKATDIATNSSIKAYIDGLFNASLISSFVAKIGDTMTGALTMSGNDIRQVRNFTITYPGNTTIFMYCVSNGTCQKCYNQQTGSVGSMC